jgi:hypothetical protein
MPLFPYRLDKWVVLICNELEIGPIRGKEKKEKKDLKSLAAKLLDIIIDWERKKE